MPAPGLQFVPAKFGELSRVLGDLSASDLAALELSAVRWIGSPLGRYISTVALSWSGSVYVGLLNLEPGGLICLRRGAFAARILALAVSPDLRRRGLARTMLDGVAERARHRKLHWLWMTIPSTNTPAMRCALACGFRRYRPQILRRDIGDYLPGHAHPVTLEPLKGRRGRALVAEWYAREIDAGDAWARDLIRAELMPLVMPAGDSIWQCSVDGRLAGCAHLNATQSPPAITLWLDPAVWGQPDEISVTRALVEKLGHEPHTFDVRLGSEGHLRASVGRFKELKFTPVLEEKIIFARAIPIDKKKPRA